jgi:hypothetical protein
MGFTLVCLRNLVPEFQFASKNIFLYIFYVNNKGKGISKNKVMIRAAKGVSFLVLA